MSGKKRPAWRIALLGLLVTLSLELLGVLLITLLTVRGTVGEGRAFPLLAVTAFNAAVFGGLAAGMEKSGSAGALLNAGIFGLLLSAACFGVWDGMTAHGLQLLGVILLGGILSGALRAKVGKRRGKRLVKSNKKTRMA